jgi:hypothetical protein
MKKTIRGAAEMKGIASIMKIIVIIFIASLFLILSPSMASDYAFATDNATPGETDAQLLSSRSQGGSSDLQEYAVGNLLRVPLAQGYISNRCQSNVCSQEGFSERLSYSGPCSGLPQGAICLTYSDNFNLVVTDYRMDCVPSFAGICSGRPIELIRCDSAYYYHVLGTLLVKIVPIKDALCLQAAPCQSTLYLQAHQRALLTESSLIHDSQNLGNNTGYAQKADGSNAIKSDAKSEDMIGSNSADELDPGLRFPCHRYPSIGT